MSDVDVSKLVDALAGNADALKHYGVLRPASEYRFLKPYLRLNDRLNGNGWWNRFWWQGIVQVLFPGWHAQLFGDLDLFKRAYQAEVLERLMTIKTLPHR